MADVTNGGDKPQETPSTRMRVLQQIMEMLQVASNAAGRVTVTGIRAVMPLLELYSATRADSIEGPTRPGTLGLSLGEERVLRAAGTRALLELMEITSATHPVFKGATPYVAFVDGQQQRPHLMHLLALAAAAREFFGDSSSEGEEPKPPTFTPAPSQTVVYLATAPGEYALHTGPLPPVEIRRSAMRQRSFAQPRRAMLVEGSDPVMIAPAATAMRYTTAARFGTAAAVGCCACGGSSCGCGGSRHRRFAPARYNEDGSCVSVATISCDTRWRVRECFKIAFCDLLRCLGEELCDDGHFAQQPDLRPCVEGFFCSLIGCLPDAICPTPEPVCCEPCKPQDNFAVGE